MVCGRRRAMSANVALEKNHVQRDLLLPGQLEPGGLQRRHQFLVLRLLSRPLQSLFPGTEHRRRRPLS